MSRITIDIARQPITFVHCEERHPVFAPSWDLLREYKGGGLSWEQYAARYQDEMRAAYRENPDPFRAMARRLNHVEFICWCNRQRGNGARCHRFLLGEILEHVRQQQNE